MGQFRNEYCPICQAYYSSGDSLQDHFESFHPVMKLQKNDAVNHPKHYTEHPSGIECIQITEHMNFNVGNAVKYLWRADLKNGLEDLQKAAWYVNREIERRTRVQDESCETSESILPNSKWAFGSKV